MLVAETYREAGEETNGCGDCVLTRRLSARLLIINIRFYK